LTTPPAGSSTDPAVDRVLDLARSRPPLLGPVRLVCVDGPAGSGKTTLAEGVAAAAAPAALVHVDDLLAGWDGSFDALVAALVDDVLDPLAEGRPAAYRRWDWHAGRFAEWVPVPRTGLLVVEGVGAGARRAAARASVLVWVEAPHDQRMARGIARDGDDFAPYWEHWARREDAHFAAEGTRARADLVVRTGTGADPVPGP
jgi:uridine kinase